MPVTYASGDASLPVPGCADVVIFHIVNDVPVWRTAAHHHGVGFAAALGARYPEAMTAYIAARPRLGDCLLVDVRPTGLRRLRIAHLCAQSGLPSRRNPRPFRLVDLGTALRSLRAGLDTERPTGVLLQGPRIGTGYGGGDWAQIQALLTTGLAPYDVRILTPSTPESPP